jgi:hypothetical protein
VIEVTDEMVEAFRATPGTGLWSTGDPDEGRRNGLAAALAVFVQRIEGERDTGLCDCYEPSDPENVPMSPRTGELMNHHCECRAVLTAAVLLGSHAETQHAKQCVCEWSP